ncbi:MAG: type II toxin-antitoxin system HicA family toxin [Porticoccaceae bacterium]
MRLPRNLDAPTLVKALAHQGYAVVRQTGSHIRLQHEGPPRHAITVPNHAPLRLGTLAAVLAEVAQHQGLSREQLLERLFGG